MSKTKILRCEAPGKQTQANADDAKQRARIAEPPPEHCHGVLRAEAIAAARKCARREK